MNGLIIHNIPIIMARMQPEMLNHFRKVIFRCCDILWAVSPRNQVKEIMVIRVPAPKDDR
jgi:hypothetical protein